MSAPSFSSFVPAFASFPDIEEGPSSGPSTEHGQLKRDRSKDPKSRRAERERGERHPSHRNRGSEPRRHQSKHGQELQDETKRLSQQFGSDSTTSGAFFSDRKGDSLNVTYGALHSGDVPRYRAYGGGRQILGLQNMLIVVSNTGKEVTVVPRDRRKIPQLSDSKTRVLLSSSKPRRFMMTEKLAAQYEEVDGFMRFPNRVQSSRDQDYRSIEMKSMSGSDASDTSSDESRTEEEDKDLYHITALEEHRRKLEHHIQQNPKDVTSWLELLAHSRIESHLQVGVRAHAEIAACILSRALKVHPDNARSPLLWMKYLAACEHIWSDAQLATAWEDAIRQADCIDLQVEWLNWRLRRTTSGLDEALQDAATLFRKDWKGVPDEQKDKASLRLLWRVAVFLKQAGYTERAHAIFQAQAQLLFKADLASRDLPFDKRLDELESFWESEEPRIGDITRSDCSIVAPATEADEYTRWATQESEEDQRSIVPLRTSDGDDEDPYSTILFSDIRPFLVAIRTPPGLKLFRLVWLHFQGLRTPGLLSTLTQTSIDSKWADTGLCTKSFLDTLFPHNRSRALPVDSMAGVIVGRERAYRSSFGNIREWGYELLEPLESLFPRGEVRMWDVTNNHVEIIQKRNADVLCRNMFKELRLNGEDEKWDVLALAYELSVNPKHATKSSKQLLSKNDHSLRLWGSHARLARIRGKIDEARKVYETVLGTLQEQTNDSSMLWWDYAEMLWLNGNNRDALDVVIRSSGQRGGSSTVIVLRAKRHLEEMIEGVITDLSNWRSTLNLIKLRILLELLTSSLQNAIDLGRRYLSLAYNGAKLHEGVVVGLLAVIYRHTVTLRNHAAPALLREVAHEAIKKYPDNTIVMGILLESEKGEALWGRIRLVLGDSLQGSSEKSVVRRLSEVWAAGWDVGRWQGEVERVRAGLEAAVTSDFTRASSILWRVFVEFEIRFGRPDRAKATLLRALGECPYTKELYLLAFGSLRGAFRRRELATLAETMAERGLRLRSSIEALVDAGSDGDEGGDTGDGELEDDSEELRRLMPY